MKRWSVKVEALLLMISSLDDLFFVRKAAKIQKRFRKRWLLHTACLLQSKDDEIEIEMIDMPVPDSINPTAFSKN